MLQIVTAFAISVKLDVIMGTAGIELILVVTDVRGLSHPLFMATKYGVVVVREGVT